MAGEKKSRAQRLVNFGSITTNAGVPVPLSATEYWVKSLIVQGLDSNTDFVMIGDLALQSHSVEPRRSIVIWGDNLDNGTAGQIDLSTVYLDVLVNGEGVNVMVLEGA